MDGLESLILRGMTRDSSPLSAHPSGDQPLVVGGEPPAGVDLDSFFGPVHVEWDQEAATTPLGQLPFFVDFLKKSGLFDAFVADCPLRYASPNAPKKRDVLGTTMLSMQFIQETTAPTPSSVTANFWPQFRQRNLITVPPW